MHFHGEPGLDSGGVLHKSEGEDSNRATAVECPWYLWYQRLEERGEKGQWAELPEAPQWTTKLWRTPERLRMFSEEVLCKDCCEDWRTLCKAVIWSSVCQYCYVMGSSKRSPEKLTSHPLFLMNYCMNWGLATRSHRYLLTAATEFTLTGMQSCWHFGPSLGCGPHIWWCSLWLLKLALATSLIKTSIKVTTIQNFTTLSICPNLGSPD